VKEKRSKIWEEYLSDGTKLFILSNESQSEPHSPKLKIMEEDCEENFVLFLSKVQLILNIF